MAPENTKYRKLAVIVTILLGVLIVALVDFMGAYAIAMVSMIAGGWMWTQPAAWAYPIILIIFVGSFIFNAFLIISVYRLLVKLFGGNMNTKETPKYIYIIAILLPIILPVLAYSFYLYSSYQSEMTEIEAQECLDLDIEYSKYSERCKQLISPEYFEPDPLGPEEFETNQLESDQIEPDQL